MHPHYPAFSKNYLYPDCYQFFFTTIEHFLRLCSISFFWKKTLMHHSAIINNLCLENSMIILYFKDGCFFTHQGDSFLQTSINICSSNTFYSNYTYIQSIHMHCNLSSTCSHFSTVLLQRTKPLQLIFLLPPPQTYAICNIRDVTNDWSEIAVGKHVHIYMYTHSQYKGPELKSEIKTLPKLN